MERKVRPGVAMMRASWKSPAIVLIAALLFGCSISPQARRDKFLARGKHLLQTKEYARAILEFKNAASAMPKDPESYYQMGLALWGTQDYRSAYAAFRKALSLDPKHKEAELKMAEIQALTNDPSLLKDSESRLKALIEGNTPSTEMLRTLAFTELKLGDSNGAIAALERALAAAPQELASVTMMVNAKVSDKDIAGAQAVLEKAVKDSPNSAPVRQALGEFLAWEKKAGEAEAAFRQALTLDPKDGAALRDLAILQLQQGRQQEAEQNLRKLSAIPGFQSSYGIYLYQQGRRDEATREFERLFKEHPGDRQIRTNLVIAYRTTNRSADANRILETALKKNGKDADALLQRGEIAIERRDYGAAEVDLNQVLKLRPNAPEIHYVLARLNLMRGMPLIYRQELTEALRLNPDLLPVRIELAQNLLNANAASTALDVLDHAPAYQKTALPLIVARNWALWTSGDLTEMRKGIDQGLAVARTADLLVQDGMWKLRAGNPAGARAALEEALKINPSDLRALQAIRQSYVAQKNAPMALEKVKEFAAEHPKSAPVQEFLGNMLLGAGQKAEARAAFAAAKQADPASIQPDMWLVRVDVTDGRLDDARQRLQDVLNRDKGNQTARLWLADVEALRGETDSAINLFRQVVTSDTGNAEAYNNLAYLLADRKPDEALKYAQTAVELTPNRPAYCDTLGWVLYRKGLYSAAVQYLERAAADKSDPVWAYHLAMAYAKAGDLTRGRTTLRTALKMNPNVPEAKAAREVIGQN